MRAKTRISFDDLAEVIEQRDAAEAEYKRAEDRYNAICARYYGDGAGVGGSFSPARRAARDAMEADPDYGAALVEYAAAEAESAAYSKAVPAVARVMLYQARTIAAASIVAHASELAGLNRSYKRTKTKVEKIAAENMPAGFCAWYSICSHEVNICFADGYGVHVYSDDRPSINLYSTGGLFDDFSNLHYEGFADGLTAADVVAACKNAPSVERQLSEMCDEYSARASELVRVYYYTDARAVDSWRRRFDRIGF